MIRSIAGALALLLALAGCAAGETAPPPATPSIPIALRTPHGAGSFPGVLILHDCADGIREVTAFFRTNLDSR